LRSESNFSRMVEQVGNYQLSHPKKNLACCPSLKLE
jgi:hypothetical protein